MSAPPGWPAISARLERELGEPVRPGARLSVPYRSRATWSARAAAAGDLVVKVRHGDRADEKTQWCADHLPLLAARGYPVPVIVWHGPLGGGWHAVVQRRLSGRSLTSLSPPLLRQLLHLVGLQADAGIPAGPRDFTGYVANVLFDGWDQVWEDAPRASPAAARLCDRLRRWLQPVWGLRLPATDFANNDLNLSNVLAVGGRITGVIDWDEFGLGSRALDLVVLAFDCERTGAPTMASELLAHAAAVVGPDAVRCLVSYRALGELAHSTTHEGVPDPPDVAARVAAAERIQRRLAAGEG
jgi:aminoglycoside phosphotransferase (APT) family kinase protein